LEDACGQAPAGSVRGIRHRDPLAVQAQETQIFQTRQEGQNDQLVVVVKSFAEFRGLNKLLMTKVDNYA